MSKTAFMILGQSNAGGYGTTRWPVSGAKACFYSHDLRGFFSAADPMPGVQTSGCMTTDGGSIWSRLGWLYSQGAYQPWDQVCFAPIDVYGSDSASWTPARENYPKIAACRAELYASGWPVSAYLWVQGETDGIAGPSNGATPGTYTANALALVDALRAAGDATPFLVCVCTTCRLVANAGFAGADFDLLLPAARLTRLLWQDQIQAEQRALGDSCRAAPRNILPGVNLDLISVASRRDGCHLGDSGQWCAAEMWLDLLSRYKQGGYIA
jgi:hypothetical protein